MGSQISTQPCVFDIFGELNCPLDEAPDVVLGERRSSALFALIFPISARFFAGQSIACQTLYPGFSDPINRQLLVGRLLRWVHYYLRLVVAWYPPIPTAKHLFNDGPTVDVFRSLLTHWQGSISWSVLQKGVGNITCLTCVSFLSERVMYA